MFSFVLLSMPSGQVIAPGEIALTRILGASSFARDFVISISVKRSNKILFFPDVAIFYISKLATVKYLSNLECHLVLVRFVLDRYSITSCQIATSQYLICQSCVADVKYIFLFQFELFIICFD